MPQAILPRPRPTKQHGQSPQRAAGGNQKTESNEPVKALLLSFFEWSGAASALISTGRFGQGSWEEAPTTRVQHLECIECHSP